MTPVIQQDVNVISQNRYGRNKRGYVSLGMRDTDEDEEEFEDLTPTQKREKRKERAEAFDLDITITNTPVEFNWEKAYRVTIEEVS